MILTGVGGLLICLCLCVLFEITIYSPCIKELKKEVVRLY